MITFLEFIKSRRKLPRVDQYVTSISGSAGVVVAVDGANNITVKWNDKSKGTTTVPLRFLTVIGEESELEGLLLSEEVDSKTLKQVEAFADKLFAKLNIDVEFTRHFADRVNDARNGKPISSAELIKLFKETYKKHGKKIAEMPDSAQAVIKQMANDINMPFVFKWDERNQEFDLVAKTIMRKKDFKTPNKVMTV